MRKLVHYNIRVVGKVQGVGYRYFAMKNAKEFGLMGYVKNLSSGSVYIEAEGEEEILDRFVTICENGPGWARIEKIETSIAPFQGFIGFRIKY